MTILYLTKRIRAKLILKIAYDKILINVGLMI